LLLLLTWAGIVLEVDAVVAIVARIAQLLMMFETEGASQHTYSYP
jgi:hypothetical protein